jgi:hypothetical protein
MANFLPVPVVTVPVPGMAQQVVLPAGVTGPGQPGFVNVHAFIIQALWTNAGKIYIGTVGLVGSSMTNLLAVLPVPTANLIPTFSVAMTLSPNSLSLADIWIDADNAGEGVLISALIY